MTTTPAGRRSSPSTDHDSMDEARQPVGWRASFHPLCRMASISCSGAVMGCSSSFSFCDFLIFVSSGRRLPFSMTADSYVPYSSIRRYSITWFIPIHSAALFTLRFSFNASSLACTLCSFLSSPYAALSRKYHIIFSLSVVSVFTMQLSRDLICTFPLLPSASVSHAFSEKCCFLRRKIAWGFCALRAPATEGLERHLPVAAICLCFLMLSRKSAAFCVAKLRGGSAPSGLNKRGCRKSDILFFWPARRDLNPQPLESESTAISNFATGGYGTSRIVHHPPHFCNPFLAFLFYS